VQRTYYNFKKRHTQGLVESKTAVIETFRPTQQDWRRCRTKTPSRSMVQAAAVPADNQGPFPSDQVSGLLVRLGQSGVSVIRIYTGLDRHKINPLLMPNFNHLDGTTPGLCKQSRYLSILFDIFCNNTLVSRIPQTPRSTTPAATLPLNHLHRRRNINPHVSTSVSLSVVLLPALSVGPFNAINGKSMFVMRSPISMRFPSPIVVFPSSMSKSSLSHYQHIFSRTARFGGIRIIVISCAYKPTPFSSPRTVPPVVPLSPVWLPETPSPTWRDARRRRGVF